MTFVIRMALRELRAGWTRLLFFFLCLALGVGSIVTLRSVVQIVRGTLTREARTLLGADVTIGTRRPWDPQARLAIEQHLSNVRVLARIEDVETLSMVRPADATKAVARLVELRGVQPGFPLYGQLELEGGVAYSHELVRGHGVLVRPELLAQLGVRVGDDIIIGDARFRIRGVVNAEPGRRAGAFSFGSRVFLDLDDLKQTGLITFGSRARYQMLLKLQAADVEPLAQKLSRQFTGTFVSVRSYRSTEDHVGEDLERTENYLSLVGLVIVVLGGIGVWSVVRVFVQQKIRTVAVLKCLGSTGRQILLIYVTQVVAMALIGSLLGVALGGGVLLWLQPTLVETAGVDAAFTLTRGAVAQGIGIGVLVSLLFSVVPLLDVRHVRPSQLLRASDPAPGRRRDWARIATILVVGAALVGMASWQAGSWRIGAILSAGFAGIILVLHGTGVVLVKATAPLQHGRWFTLRYAARRISRPGSQIQAILLAVGLGAFVIVGVRSLQQNLLREFQLELRPDSPDMFLIDVQPDQAGAVSAFLRDPRSGVRATPRLIPVLRARVTGVRGTQTNLDGYEEVRGRGSLGREYVVTYRAGLEGNERLVAGRFWPSAPGATAEVSIEQGLRDRADLTIGDMIRFDILGRVIEARVTSVRAVDWADARAGGFMFVFRPGVLDRAPHTFIAPVRGPAATAARARLQRDLTARFPNVSVVDVQEILVTAGKILANITLAITVVGSLVLFSGILILIGSVSMAKFQRIYEAAVLKALGATSWHVAAMILLEYSLLGFLAGTVGSTGALALSWAVSHLVLKVTWHPLPGPVLGGIAVSTVLVAAVGILASLDVLRRKPLATLRAE